MVNRLSFVLVMCLVIAACATTPADPNRAARPACDQSVNCFYERNIRSFQVIDDQTVVVLVGRDQCPFKLELDGFFCDVSLSSVLAFGDPDGRICTWDRSFVVGGPFAREDEYCRVRQVTPLTDDELLEAYATSGLRPPLPATGSGELEVVEEVVEEVPSNGAQGTPQDAEAGAEVEAAGPQLGPAPPP